MERLHDTLDSALIWSTVACHSSAEYSLYCISFRHAIVARSSAGICASAYGHASIAACHNHTTCLHIVATPRPASALCASCKLTSQEASTPDDARRHLRCYFASQEPHEKASTRGRKRPRMAATTAVAPAAAAPAARNAHMPQQPMLEYSNSRSETAANSRIRSRI